MSPVSVHDLYSTDDLYCTDSAHPLTAAGDDLDHDISEVCNTFKVRRVHKMMHE